VEFEAEGGAETGRQVFTNRIVLEAAPMVGDFTGDGRVDLEDFAKLGELWGRGDAAESIRRLNDLAEHWLAGK